MRGDGLSGHTNAGKPLGAGKGISPFDRNAVQMAVAGGVAVEVVKLHNVSVRAVSTDN